MQILVQTRTANIQLYDYCISVTFKKKKTKVGGWGKKRKSSPALKSRCGATGPWVFQKHLILALMIHCFPESLH